MWLRGGEAERILDVGMMIKLESILVRIVYDPYRSGWWSHVVLVDVGRWASRWRY